MSKAKSVPAFRILSAALSLIFLLAPLSPVIAAKKGQDPVTGAFQGVVSEAGRPSKRILGARVEIMNIDTGAKYVRVTDASGNFYVGRLSPGVYKITITASSYQAKDVEQRLYITQMNTVLPVPVDLVPVAEAAPPIISTGPTPLPQPSPTAAPGVGEVERINLQVGRLDGRRGGSFNENQVATLPLGATTYVRSFDELALLLPGVTSSPFTLGNVSGPGVGPGVGSAGQFSVNGLPPRANNFTVDGSDNNDEDIGVRRQGFFALVPQPVESIKEYQVITLLAPAQFGRNIGAQVNAVSKSGTNDIHGDFYGFFNSSQLNARNVFDTVGANEVSQLTTLAVQRQSGGNIPARGVVECLNVACTSMRPINIVRDFGDEDSSTLGMFGFTFGGPIKKGRWFYFLSGERQVLNAAQEKSFAVPTVEQRGYGFAAGTAFNPQDPSSGSGATGITTDPLTLNNGSIRDSMGNVVPQVIPQTMFGAAIFSLFPFPNNPTGVYGANTFTQVLPASGRGAIASGKINYENPNKRLIQSFTTRYNFTQDWRDIPAAGDAIFAALRPAVGTQNLSTFLNSEFSGPNASTQVYNQVRLSYGRTRLRFDELRDPSLLPSRINQPFLLNARLLRDVASSSVTSTSPVPFIQTSPTGGCVRGGLAGTTECVTGPLGQVNIAGFSPVGVDVFNFPQRRVNNTYQLADTMSIRESGKMAVTYTFGTDLRRSELNSDLPRNARPLISFVGTPALVVNTANPPNGCGGLCALNTVPYIPATWFAAAGVPSAIFQSFSPPGKESGNIALRYYQLNFFGQEEFRLTNSLSLTLGVRYEYNTPARETHDRIENIFQSLDLITGGSNASRSGIYDPDRNNFAPRIGVAWAPNLFGADHPTVIRGGFGVFYDQIIGSVVSQSRNVFPTFLALNLASGTSNPFINTATLSPTQLEVGQIPTPNPQGAIAGPCLYPINPICSRGVPLLDPNTPNNLNTLNPILASGAGLGDLILAVRRDLKSGFSFTAPNPTLQMPMAYHYSYTVEQGLPHNMLLSLAYVGTRGRNLLRITTPNGGPYFLTIGSTVDPRGFSTSGQVAPGFTNATIAQITRVNQLNIGAFNLIETTGRSQYDALQTQLRGRLMGRRAFLYEIGYTYSRARDSVSDVFDLAGAPALPQQSTTFLTGGQISAITNGNFPGEYSRSNYDAPHRVSYDLVWDIMPGKNGLQIASTGQFQSGQPFTVNSIIDVNHDGNLTDRLNTTSGINLNGSDRQPIQLGGAGNGTLTCPGFLPVQITGADTHSLLACQGFNGAIPRNSFRAGMFRLVNLTVIKKFSLSETTTIAARVDMFNLLDRNNFNIPVRILESPGFGSATETVTPGRRIQFGLKLSF
jgi:hypothetical protein